MANDSQHPDGFSSILPDSFPEFHLEEAEQLVSQSATTSREAETEPTATQKVLIGASATHPDLKTPIAEPAQIIKLTPEELFGSKSNTLKDFETQGQTQKGPPQLDPSHPAAQIPSPHIQVEEDFEAWRARMARTRSLTPTSKPSKVYSAPDEDSDSWFGSSLKMRLLFFAIALPIWLFIMLFERIAS